MGGVGGTDIAREGLGFLLDPDWRAGVAASCHEKADKSETVSKCYFIGGDHGFIKIGHSTNPASRLRGIQSCSPIPVRILALREGGEEREGAYHWQFGLHRQYGEWFDRHPDILAEIARIAAVAA